MQDLHVCDAPNGCMRPVHRRHTEHALVLPPARPYRERMLLTLRHLLRHKVSAAAMILTVALVTGAGTSVAAFINATLIRPLPYPNADRLVAVHTMPPDGTSPSDWNPLHALDIIRFRERLRRADAMEAAWREDKIVTTGAGTEPISVPAARVSPGFLALLGGAPVMGRLWTTDEDLAQRRVCVLSYGLWQRMFGGDPSVIGRTIVIDRDQHEIIGVLQKNFRPSYIPSELWTPLVLRMEALPTPRSSFINGIARLAPGATEAQLNDEVAAVMRDIVAESPSTHAGYSAGIDSLRRREYGDQRTAAAILAAAVTALALIALANLANVRLARAIAERADVALRLALGASRWDLVRAQLAEDALIALFGGALGLAIAASAMPLLRSIDPRSSAAIGDVPIDWRVMLASWVTAGAVSMLSGLIPVWRESRRDLVSGLMSSGRRTTGSPQEARMRRNLVAGEAALALLLLVCGSVFTAALARAAHRDVGFDAANVLAGQLRMPETAYPTVEARGTFARAVLERVRALPGVVSAATTLNPFSPNGSYVTGVRIEGHPLPVGGELTAGFRRVSDGYFSTMKVPIRQGRAIGPEDRVDSMPVIVVSQSFAAKFWPGEDPMGRRLIRGKTTYTVVGIAGDIEDSGAGQSSAAIFYIPFAQNSAALTGATLVVRTAGRPEDFAAAVRAAVLEVDPNQPLEKITTFESFFSASLGPDRFRGTLLGVLAVLGLLLTAVGIYGVTSCLVEERAREMGVRLVLGASPRQLFRMVVGGAVFTVTIGSVMGLASAALAATTLRKLLPALTTGAPPTAADLWAAWPACLCLAVAAFVAAGLPARRAARADAREVLR
jgi:putative ABC transport system permease protein